MTSALYRRLEDRAVRNLFRIKESGFPGGDIVFVMSKDVYLNALTMSDTICTAADYDGDGVQVGSHSVYLGYDIFIINEDVHIVFQPAIKDAYKRCVDYNRLHIGDIVLSHQIDGEARIFVVNQADPFACYDSGMTARKTHVPEKFSKTYACERMDKKTYQDNEWDRRLTCEDTAELDEFLNSLVRKDVPKPET